MDSYQVVYTVMYITLLVLFGIGAYMIIKDLLDR